MSSERRARANRANARRSTGPKSAQGKARAAQNARRHGLSQGILTDPVLAGEVEALAQRLAQEAGRCDLIDLARRIAEAQIDVQRIRQFRQRRLRQAVTQVAGTQGGRTERALGAEEMAAVLAPLAPELKAIELYARRALSRRKFAIRDFAAAQRQCAEGVRAWECVRSPGKGNPRRAWRPKFPRCVGEALRQLEGIRQQSKEILEHLAAAKARAAARREGKA